jgi:hypothetical protein
MRAIRSSTTEDETTAMICIAITAAAFEAQGDAATLHGGV